MAASFRTAEPSDLVRLERSLVAAHVAVDAAELRAIHSEAPWRFQVSEKGDLVVLGRWRDHLPYLAIEHMWCQPFRLQKAIAHVKALAWDLGLSDVVSPPVAVEDADAYRVAGMRPQTVVATYRLSHLAGSPAPSCPPGLAIRDAREADIPTLLDVDARCFEPFWRYDRRHIERFYSTARLRVAERGDEPVGYTLCTVSGDEGLLGRLCVLPEHRRQGAAMALLEDAVQCEWDRGAERVMLSTQTDNLPAHALYRKARFRDTGRRYAFLRFGNDEG